MSTQTFVSGLILLVLLPFVGGFGIGQLELAIWLALVAAWTVLWMRRRRTA